MHHGGFCSYHAGLLFAIGGGYHPWDPSLADYNPAGFSGIAKELVAGLDRFGHQCHPGLVDPRTVTEKSLAGWDLAGWDLVGWDPVGWDLVGWDLVGHNHSAVRRIGFGKDPAGWRLDHHTAVVLGTEMGSVGRRSDRRTAVAVHRIETFFLRVVIGVSNDERVNYGK